MINNCLNRFLNSHADGHHKLIWWKMVTHAAIDDFSRLIVFMKCSSNNKAAATVYECFLNATQLYGLPSRVRSDQGKENCLVAQRMLQQHLTWNRSSQHDNREFSTQSED